jgi:hypothetical protein
MYLCQNSGLSRGKVSVSNRAMSEFDGTAVTSSGAVSVYAGTMSVFAE